MNRSRGLAILGLLIGAGTALMAYLPVWVSFAAGSIGLPTLHSSFTGRQVVPVAAALALVVLAGSVAVWALRGVWVRIAGAVLVLASGAMAFASIAFIADPLSAFKTARDASGVGAGELGATTTSVTTSMWWAVALAGGLVAFMAALVVTGHRGRWDGMSARYARAEVDSSTDRPVPRTGAAAWDALDRGDDPTVEPGA